MSLGTDIREAFSTSNVTTLMRLLPCVGSNVDSQSTSLDEALATLGCHARVWPLVGVNSIVSLKIPFPVEALLQRIS